LNLVIIDIEGYKERKIDFLNGIWLRYSSRWWKDIITLERSVGSSWFNSEVVRKVDNESETNSWMLNGGEK